MGEKMPNMRRWTDEKLAKEISFANAADDGGPECLAWNIALSEETKRRDISNMPVNRTVSE